MKTLTATLLVCALTLVAGCGSSITINHDWDPDYNYATLKNYAWLKINAPADANQLAIKRFADAVETQLNSKGFVKNAQSADFLLVIHTGTEEKLEVTDWGYSYGGYMRGYGSRTDVYSYEQGTVVVDLIDGESRELFWRGTASATVEEGLSPEAQQAKFNDAAKKIFSKFPPKN
jgi:hypothetical protein